MNAVNPYVPAAFSWPSTFTSGEEAYLKSEIQRLISLLGMKTSIYNVETRVGTNGKPYIMEVSPRGGGNRLAEMLRYASGVDLITACTRAAVGDSVENIQEKAYDGCWAEVVLHSKKTGTFKELQIADSLPAKVVERDLWVKTGDHVCGFEGANNAIGMLILSFKTNEELLNALKNQDSWLNVVVE